MWKALVFCFAVVATAHSVLLPFLQPPKHDGVKRVCHLSSDNFTTVVSAADTAVVVVKDAAVTSKAGCPTDLEVFAELTAQVLRKRNSIVCDVPLDVLNAIQNADPAVSQAKAGEVYIYKKGRGIPYYGKRSTRALLNHLFKVNGTEISVITGKIDKMAFDAVEEVKVVGFFLQGAADHKAFEEAAATLSSSVRFYAAYDRIVAKHLKLTNVGEIHLIKPLMKTPVVCPQNPASAADIEAFVKTNQGALLTKIDEHNLHDPTLLDPSKTLILAIGEESGARGGYFYRLITKLARNNTNNTEFEKLNVVWIEPHLFPTIHLVMDELETTLGIPNKLPALGAINMTTMQGSWLNTATLNCSGDKMADAQNLQLLQDFLDGVITNTLTPIKIGGQSFVATPSPQTVSEHSDVLLECVVEHPAGDCLWLKDGRAIGYNLDRHPGYSWRGDRAAGDCSLLIRGVSAGRDAGEWVCEVTGDQDNQPIASPPAKLLVAAAADEPKAEL